MTVDNSRQYADSVLKAVDKGRLDKDYLINALVRWQLDQRSLTSFDKWMYVPNDIKSYLIDGIIVNMSDDDVLKCIIANDLDV